MAARKSFPLRIQPELYQALESWAQQEFRSVNAQIEYLLKEAVRKRGREVPDESPRSGQQARDPRGSHPPE